MIADFIPYRWSRNAGAWESINWRVTLCANGLSVHTVDYAQGIGYLPKAVNPRNRADIATAIETGRTQRGHPLPLPALADVLYSLARDAQAMYTRSFDTWADDNGMDPDSRKAEAMYRECIATATALIATLGLPALEALIAATEDY